MAEDFDDSANEVMSDALGGDQGLPIPGVKFSKTTFMEDTANAFQQFSIGKYSNWLYFLFP